MVEADLTKKIKKALFKRFVPSFWFKCHGGRFQQAGLPDIIGCYKGRFYGIEVKLPGKEDTLTKNQKYVIDLINLCGGRATMVTSIQQAVDFVAKK